MSPIASIIIQAKKYLPSLNEARIQQAFEFADAAHKGQTRFSGEPYIIHPVEVASILLEFHPDEDTIVAALLHDVAEDTDRTLDDIEKVFGAEVRGLCFGTMKLSKVRSKLNDPQVENLRKLFLAMAKDFRVVILKLCDRLHNMRTLGFVRPEKRTRIAQETLNIYAPIASRMGIYRLKSQLEDLCFEHLHPEDFRVIQDELIKTGEWRERYIENARQILTETLAKEGIKAYVDGRVKSTYSIYRKLKRKGKNSVSDIFDVFAMRVVLPDISKYDREYTGHLYTALGTIHNHFTPLANRFKDYIAVPKVNGYRSLHTTVVGLGPKEHTQPTEIQFRTESMHQASELGIAAHWLYEEGKEGFLQQQKEWMSGLMRIEREISNNQELLENLKIDVFQDRIFVLTPRGDVKDLPTGASPIDFAYSVHTEIGNTCIGAKVNGNIVPVDYELKSGEVVEVITRKNAQPSQSWLSFIKTNHAKNRIRNWFKNLDDDKHLKAGRLLLNEKLQQLGHAPLDNTFSLLRTYNGKRLTLHQRQELLIEIGKGAALTGTVIRKIFTMEELLSNKPTRPAVAPKFTPAPMYGQGAALSIGGQMNLPYQFVQCCHAKFSDELIGYITRGRGVSIHKKKCSVIRNTESTRFVKVKIVSKPSRYAVRITVEAEDRVGLVRDVSHLIAESGLHIAETSQNYGASGITTLSFLLEMEQFDQLERILSRLEKIPSVRRACKTN
ncbi:MAG: bifunctional (p)ppGpp synthetase/guanosine-3',5'-bis(diphosphate) 3'-pyrophosphohydrolase [Patescibacteria group bacterium]